MVEDNGIGMSKEELVGNIGTIAHSGTLDYLKKISESPAKGQVDLIGKFGVGFYSSFMVAKEIHIASRSWRPGQPGLAVEIQGRKQLHHRGNGKNRARARASSCSLKKDEKEFLETHQLKHIILKHSKFVPFPIYLEGEKIERKEAIWTQPKSKLRTRITPSSTNSSKTPRRSRRPTCTCRPTPRCSSPPSCSCPRPRSSCWG